jgi:hypothetical protein
MAPGLVADLAINPLKAINLAYKFFLKHQKSRFTFKVIGMRDPFHNFTQINDQLVICIVLSKITDDL